jgi:adenylate cyclase
VEVIANATQTIISGAYLQVANIWQNLLAIVLMAALAFGLTRLKSPVLALGLMVGGVVLYVLVFYGLFAWGRTYIAFFAPLMMLALGVLLPTAEQAVSQELEKRRVRNLFSRFISPEMVNQMMETQDLNSLNKRADITVLFSDIRGFTTMSEQLTPEGVVAILNPYLEAMTELIDAHNGTVDKYEGDAIMAFYGEPVSYADHARRGVATAVDMHLKLRELKQVWGEQDKLPPSGKFDIGIGLNSGEAFVGLLGSAQRINYTVIGDNVNLAARLQDLTKQYKWPILISEATWLQVQDEFDAEFADAVVVKGKTEPVNIYKVLGRKGAPPELRVHALDI